ncbi:STAS domain-containing protein [Pontibacterium granulatum]|uniref:STAS domain-containing protein n=1 Tax=Pontibacterium granulatum TaxID=2036029 RepID=UPI00249C1274|nr:STAS domain-containing protein [Pontibacterium granulatum]MDI3324434.1 STAS domain-containing protein [Pontibacterium granulatum]
MKEGSIFSACVDGRYILKFVGDVRLTLCATLDCHIEETLSGMRAKDILVDLTEAEGIDSTSLGLIAKLSVKAYALSLPQPTVVSTNDDITRVLMSMGFDHIFVLLSELPTCPSDLKQLPFVQDSEESIRQRIIAAHRILIELNDSNREAFRDLVTTLEKC